MTHRKCPSCGAQRGGHLVTDLVLRAPDEHPLGRGYPVVSCGMCGCGFADVVVPDAYYEDYYRNLAKYGGESAAKNRATSPSSERDEPLRDPAWLTKKADDSALRIEEQVSSKGARILDVGCSTGGLLGALVRRGFVDVCGVDPSAESVRLANTRHGVRAEVGVLSALPIPEGGFDCICLTGVLEHIWNVDEAIRSVVPLLRPEGIIYIEVPDGSRYLDPYVSPFEDFNTEHVNHFSFAQLRTLASRHGMATIGEVSYAAALTSAVDTSCVAVTWSAGSSPAQEVQHDDSLEAALRTFAERSIRDMGWIENELEQRLADSDQYVLWGVGESAFKLLALKPLATRKAVLYADSNVSRHGFRFDGSPVVSPTEIESGPVPIVIGSLTHAGSIANAVGELHLQNSIVRLDGWREGTGA
jgi:2-polyprenyl-3-methyl-5-hydroxy-6-metoxy-1,4-benzoquinol methylase